MVSNIPIQSPADVVNAALGRIGSKKRIGSIFEGSDASKAALDIYSQTRDEQLRLFDWGFAERDVALTLQKTAPVAGYGGNPWTSASPILPWIYQYEYPDDCLKVRSLRVTPVFVLEFDPAPVTFRVANDASFTPAQKVILANVANSICVYTAQVTDPTTWEPSFTESLIAAMARRLAGANTALKQIEGQDEALETVTAEMKVG